MPRPPSPDQRSSFAYLLELAWPLLNRDTLDMVARRAELSDWCAIIVDRADSFVRKIRDPRVVRFFSDRFESVAPTVSVGIYDAPTVAKVIAGVTGDERFRNSILTKIAGNLGVVLLGPGALFMRFSKQILASKQFPHVELLHITEFMN